MVVLRLGVSTITSVNKFIHSRIKQTAPYLKLGQFSKAVFISHFDASSVYFPREFIFLLEARYFA